MMEAVHRYEGTVNQVMGRRDHGWPFSLGIAIRLAVFGFNMLGDALRDRLDPKLRGGGPHGSA